MNFLKFWKRWFRSLVVGSLAVLAVVGYQTAAKAATPEQTKSKGPSTEGRNVHELCHLVNISCNTKKE